MSGIKELKESINAGFDLIEEGLKIKKSGVQSAMGDIFALYGKLSAAWDGHELIAGEAADIDEAEATELARLFVERMGGVLLAAGVAADSRLMKSFRVLPRALALAQHNYVEGKAIYEEVK